jgi:hypothetical protein
LQSRTRESIDKKRLLSNGSLLWWEAVLLDWLFPLVRHGLGGFLWTRRTRGREMMEVYANGFVEHQGGYFTSRESALGVMTSWHALMRIPNGGGFSPTAKGFSIEQCSWLPNKDFLRILRQGTRVCAYSARVKVPECVQNSEGSHAQIKGNHHKTNEKDKISYLLPKFQYP